MTQGEKQELLVAISGYLPYGLKLQYKQDTYKLNGEKEIINVDVDLKIDEMLHNRLKLLDFKPYLRPMSSMTEKEEREYDVFCCEPYLGIDETTASNFINWLNAHYFDYRGLIEKGLAIEAPKEIYNTI